MLLFVLNSIVSFAGPAGQMCLRARQKFGQNIHRGVEQLVARWAHNPKVVGSSPAPATT